MAPLRITRRSLLLLAAAGLLAAQTAVTPAPDLAHFRTVAIAPRSTPPAWLDWNRIEGAMRLGKSKGQAIGLILSTTSLVSTYAAVDIAPVLIHTGRLVNDSQKRLDETGEWVGQMTQPAATREEFLAKNYKRAYDLGMLHASLAHAITAKTLAWNPTERVTFNQQAYAFVLYSFAWQPVEAMEAVHMVDPVRDREALEDWLHLWRVLGYAMGVDEALLPTGLDQAQRMAEALRRAQYAAPGDATPAGVPDLLRGELQVISAHLAGPQNPPDAKSNAVAAKILAEAIAVSPGLSDALGLGGDLVNKLTALVTPANAKDTPKPQP